MKKNTFALSLILVLALIFPLFSLDMNTYAAKKPKLNKKKISLVVGKTYKLKVKNNKKKVTWKSSNKKIATVSSKGKVKAKKVGKAKITAKIKKRKLICKITVKKTPTPNIEKKPKVTPTPKPQITAENSIKINFYDDLDTCGPFRSGNQEYELTNIRVWWEYDSVFNHNHVKIYFSGKKVSDTFSDTYNSPITIHYKIYNLNGAVVESGFAMTPSICVGDTFEDVEATVSLSLPNGTYGVKIQNQ